MKTYKYITILVAIFTSLVFVQCKDADDNGNVIGIAACDDGLQNGDEDGVDCGGANCVPCTTGLDWIFREPMLWKTKWGARELIRFLEQLE